MSSASDAATDNRLLAPYVPRLLTQWLQSEPEITARTLDATGVFADISGFTNLTERLARRGKVGAEEMGDTLNAIFAELLSAAYAYGAGLVKWGGDAVLLLFDGDDHCARAASASIEMQRVIKRIGKVATSVGPVRLRMSIGMHSGPLDFLVVGDHYRELIVTGPGATRIAQMEKAASAGEVVVSPESANFLTARGARIGEPRETGYLLDRAPLVEPTPAPPLEASTVDLTQAFCSQLAQHLLSGRVEYEHRAVVVSFVEFSGVDAVRESEGLAAVTERVAEVVNACQAAALANAVTILSSDITEDGGKIILISGAPVSEGDDAARVLCATREILDTPLRLPVRAGVHAGRAFAGDYGPWFRRVYSVTGDCINLAARLMSKAAPGELLTTPLVLDRSRTQFAVRELASFSVKGKAEPITALSVGAIKEPAGSGSAEMPLVGRAEELAALLAAANTASGGTGRVVELVGEAGIGKSRLIQELIALSGLDVIQADGDIYATRTPYQPMHKVFRERLRAAEASPTELGDRLRDILAARVPQLLPMLPLIATVAGAQVEPTPEVDALDTQVRKAFLESATSSALSMSFAKPTLFVFNDVHFMDDATTDLLDRLAADALDRPWLILASRRPSSQWRLFDAEHTSSIALRPLSASAADDLLTTALGNLQVPANRMATLIERGGGNPLFLRELALSASMMTSDGVIPDSIEAVIAARIDRLAPPQKTLLRSSAVLGMSVEPHLLTSILSDDEHGSADVVGGLGELHEFLDRDEDGSFHFSHHLVRETAYEGLPFRRRVHLHSKAADYLERNSTSIEEPLGLLSLHSYLGERYDRAYEYSRRAGLQARRQYANSEAADCLERALSCTRHLDAVPDRELANLCSDLSDIYSALGDYERAGRLLARARSKAKADPHLIGEIAIKTAVNKRELAQYRQAMGWITRGRRVLADHNDLESLGTLARLAELYARVAFSLGRHGAAITWADRAIEEARRAGDMRTRARAVELRCLAVGLSGQSVDFELARTGIALFAELDDFSGLARGNAVLGVLCLAAGHWSDALDHYAEATKFYERIGRQLDVALMETNRAEILIAQGKLEGLEEILGDAIRIWRGTNARSELGFGYTQLARVCAARGEYEAALTQYHDARTILDEIGESYEVRTVDALIAECLLDSGDPRGASEWVAKTIAQIEGPLDECTQLPHLQRVRALSFLAEGQDVEGYAELRESLAGARQRSAPYDIALALASLLRAHAAVGEEKASMRTELAELRERLGLPTT